MSAMSISDEPHLAPPGAGLPLVELWAARLLFGLTRWRGNLESFAARFEQERAAIRELVKIVRIGGIGIFCLSGFGLGHLPFPSR